MSKTINEFWRAIFVATVLLLTYVSPSHLMAASPTDQIRATVNEVIAILKDPQFNPEERHGERRQQLRQAIYQRFDFSEMARRSLGRQWRQLTPVERKEFTSLFTDLLERTYISRLESFDDEEMIFLRERREGDYAEVESHILTHKGGKLSVKYRSYLVNGEWRIYDIVAENISLVNNYRAQFKRILAKSSYEELVRRIRKKL